MMKNVAGFHSFEPGAFTRLFDVWDVRRNLGTIECHSDGCVTLGNVSTVEAYFL